MSDIGERIRQARLQRGMSQEELGLAVGYSGRTAINKIEKGKFDPGREYLSKIADVLGVTEVWLLGLDEDKERILEEAFSRPEMRMLFSVAEDCTAEEIEQAIKIIEALKK